jgi:predicted MFS family arabinose efflux permease
MEKSSYGMIAVVTIILLLIVWVMLPSMFASKSEGMSLEGLKLFYSTGVESKYKKVAGAATGLGIVFTLLSILYKEMA